MTDTARSLLKEAQEFLLPIMIPREMAPRRVDLYERIEKHLSAPVEPDAVSKAREAFCEAARSLYDRLNANGGAHFDHDSTVGAPRPWLRYYDLLSAERAAKEPR